MNLLCPQCGLPIDPAEVNIHADLAKCLECNELLRASELVADVTLAECHQPPAGSRIRFEPQSTGFGAFFIPRSGFRPLDVFSVFFALIWTGFLVVWVVLVLSAGGAAGLCPMVIVVPHMLIGIGFWWGIITGITESQEISLDTDSLVIQKTSALHARRTDIPYADIRVLETRRWVPRNPITLIRYARETELFSCWGGIPMIEVQHRSRKIRFAETVSDAEREWLLRILKALLFRKTGQRL